LLLTTLQADLLTCEPEAPYDVIVCHSLLPFLGDSERHDLLRRFAAWLSPGGSLILAVRLKHTKEAADNERSQPSHWVATRVAEASKALAERLSTERLGVAWRAHQDEWLEGYYRFMTTQNLSYVCAEDAVDEFRRAGLTVTTILPGGEGLSFMTADWRSQKGVPGLVLRANRSDQRAATLQEDFP
jgi:hypothetical protein